MVRKIKKKIKKDHKSYGSAARLLCEDQLNKTAILRLQVIRIALPRRSDSQKGLL